MPDKKPAKPLPTSVPSKTRDGVRSTPQPGRLNESSIRGGTVVTNTKPPPGPKVGGKGK